MKTAGCIKVEKYRIAESRLQISQEYSVNTNYFSYILPNVDKFSKIK